MPNRKVRSQKLKVGPIRFTPHPKVLRHIDTLLATGLYGRSRSELVKRLVCEGLVRRIGNPKFSLKEQS